ncbi:MAG: GIY-YIG nuclease family protein [Mesorhizobium sp.]|nr:MAG: GIY-YIG nuclease family protein [Mesorhizobium sp.]
MTIIRKHGPRPVREDRAFVYVMTAEHGGVSTDPTRRCKAVNRNKAIKAVVVFQRHFADHQDAERLTHIALAKWHLSGEWYSCPVETAVAAVEALPT